MLSSNNSAFRFIAFFVLLCAFSNEVFAQKDKRIGSWTVLNFQYVFTPKWGTWAELQSRELNPFYNIFYYETKGGFFYNLDNNFQLLAGTGYYATHGENFSEGPERKEFRVWQQVIFNQYYSRVKFEHRFRIEERWINKEFNNRFRYRITVAVPLNHKQIIPKTVFLAAYNEIFLTTKPPHFMRNRAYMGVGYQINKILTAQVGWLNQYNYEILKTNDKNNIVLNFNIRIQDKSEFKHRLPTPD